MLMSLAMMSPHVFPTDYTLALELVYCFAEKLLLIFGIIL